MIKSYIFDLDDTLYSEIDFVKSGLRYVANEICKANSSLIYDELFEIWQSDKRKVFDIFLSRRPNKLNVSLNELVNLYKTHLPRISTSPGVLRTLERISRQKHNIGIITDGTLATQQNKFSSLNIEKYVKKIIFTDELGKNKFYYKPHQMSYQIMENVFSDSSSFAYIGDNPNKDFLAPKKLGWTTFRIRKANGIYSKLNTNQKYIDYELTDISQVLDIF